jgi:hypothetical protein
MSIVIGMSVFILILVIAALCILYYSALKTPSNNGLTSGQSSEPSLSPLKQIPVVWVDGQTVPIDDRMFEVAFGGVSLSRENREAPTITFNMKVRHSHSFIQCSCTNSLLLYK